MNNKTTTLTILIIILLICSCAIGFFFGQKYSAKNNDNMPKNEEKVEENKEEENKKEDNKEETEYENISINKEKANEEIDRLFIGFQMTGMIDDETIIGPSRRNNTEILDALTKLKLAWFYILEESDDKVMIDASPSGEEITGSVGVDLEFFKSFYKSMFGEELPSTTDYSLLGYDKDNIKNGILYGTIASGIITEPIVAKVNSITKYDDRYELLIDVLKFPDIDDPNYEKYSEYNIVSYPQEYILYHLKITYIQNNNQYIMKSMVAF